MLTQKEKQQHLEAMLHEWERARYNAEINAKVSLAIEDHLGLKRAKESLIKAEKAIDYLSQLLEDLNHDRDPDTGNDLT